MKRSARLRARKLDGDGRMEAGRLFPAAAVEDTEREILLAPLEQWEFRYNKARLDNVINCTSFASSFYVDDVSAGYRGRGGTNFSPSLWLPCRMLSFSAIPAA